MRKVLDEEPTPPSQIAEVPEGLDEILLTALAKERETSGMTMWHTFDALQELFDKL